MVAKEACYFVLQVVGFMQVVTPVGVVPVLRQRRL
jgi:hypothetical protein